jgi:hypothetical protein
MPAEAQSVGGVNPAQSPGAAPAVPHGTNGVAKALTALREAVASRDNQSIVAAYQVLREAALGMRIRDLIAMADDSLGQGVTETVLPAFSNLTCYMCSHGAIPCDLCEGTGVRNNHVCDHCDGLGFSTCTFCRGTGWTDRSIVPDEFKQAVIQRQGHICRQEFREIRVLLKQVTPQTLSSLSTERRRKLSVRLSRLQCRLHDVAEALPDDPHNAGMTAAADFLERHLQMIRDSFTG